MYKLSNSCFFGYNAYDGGKVLQKSKVSYTPSYRQQLKDGSLLQLLTVHVYKTARLRLTIFTGGNVWNFIRPYLLEVVLIISNKRIGL